MCVERVGKVVSLPSEEEGVAIVDIAGSLHRVSTALLVFDGVEVLPGDWLQAHTGLAVRVLPEPEARRLVAAYEEMQAAVTDRT
jgi:hydrogenase assembly chaperone HypC/HupF